MFRRKSQWPVIKPSVSQATDQIAILKFTGPIIISASQNKKPLKIQSNISKDHMSMSSPINKAPEKMVRRGQPCNGTQASAPFQSVLLEVYEIHWAHHHWCFDGLLRFTKLTGPITIIIITKFIGPHQCQHT